MQGQVQGLDQGHTPGGPPVPPVPTPALPPLSWEDTGQGPSHLTTVVLANPVEGGPMCITRMYVGFLDPAECLGLPK